MIFFLAVIAIFVITSVYFYFRAESLQNQLVNLRRELSTVKKESKVLVDSMAMIAKKNEDFAKFRIQKIREASPEESEVYVYLYPLISNYSAIFIECAKANGLVHSMAKKCFDSFEPGSYGRFKSFIGKQNVEVKRMWNSNNLNGFMTFIEAMLREQERQQQQMKEPQILKERSA
ncbi:hypothetical protein [Thalassotalea fusca]